MCSLTDSDCGSPCSDVCHLGHSENEPFHELSGLFSARCVHETNRHAIAMVFARPFVCLSVRLSGTGVHCDHTVHFSVVRRRCGVL